MKHRKDAQVVTPDLYDPVRPEELIGDARQIAVRLLKHVKERKGALKAIMFGSPGCGKTTIVNMVCRKLAKHEVDVEKMSGRIIAIETVREWIRNLGYASLFGGWKVKHIEEVDLLATVSQDVMLSYLDDLPEGSAVIGTSNASLESLTERFQTRFQLIPLHGPSHAELAGWLEKRWKVPHLTAEFIAMGAGANVRQALLAAQGFQMFGKTEMPPMPTGKAIDPARSASARKAWETIRRNGNG